MPRDKETGKPKGFAFLMYEDQRSTVLAVDNLNGATVLERVLRVDHVANYKVSGITPCALRGHDFTGNTAKEVEK